VNSEHASKPVQELGEDESYTLEVTSSGAQLNAPTTLGVMRGLQTFLQLVEITPQGFAVPAVVIQDKPRFAWRGLMIDVGRHFMPMEVIKRNLDGMAAVKMNVFHWHLSDNQGFRVESKRFPKLQEMGSDGLYYTQEQVRDVISYAHDRGIRVIPEFDMPGHSTAWFVGYPDLASAPGPYTIERKWGVFDPAMDPTRESTYKFLDAYWRDGEGVSGPVFSHRWG
jgi:hexosaminidase